MSQNALLLILIHCGMHANVCVYENGYRLKHFITIMGLSISIAQWKRTGGQGLIEVLIGNVLYYTLTFT